MSRATVFTRPTMRTSRQTTEGLQPLEAPHFKKFKMKIISLVPEQLVLIVGSMLTPIMSTLLILVRPKWRVSDLQYSHVRF